jgi:cellulose synthase/poly-beta-1,6-N-acetylglucosamine synthase-like glycosyltransferase
MSAMLVAEILAGIYIVCAALITCFVASLLYLVWLHSRLRAAGLAREAELLARALPPDGELPHVVVQIPSFNEGTVLRRGVEAAAALDWPRDRLHIQILDDSTDETAALARALQQEISARGIDIVALQRTDRAGFKGGALHEGMQRTPHRYFAIFDVDYVPAPDFLRRCMRAMLAPGKTAFVQARFDFLNPYQNALTEMQMVTLDGHLGIEQATRSWAGHPLPFNGTCGIWSRDAIEAGGGWKGDTVTEDLDLTYRTWLQGWRGIFLTSVAVPGELPSDVATFVRQQQRWVEGFSHVSLRVAPEILRHPGLSPGSRLAAFLHLCMALNRPLLLLGIVCMIAAIVLAPSMAPRLLGIFAAALLFAIATQATMLWAGHRFLRGDKALPPGQFAALIGRAVRWQIRQLFHGLGVFVRQVFKPKPIEFDRTPKKG